MRFAIINTQPDVATRDVLFDDAERITEVTGWYPLVMGFRAASSRKLAPLWHLLPEQFRAFVGDRPFGSLTSIRRVDSGAEGCALSLDGTRGSILLDLGFDFDLSMGASGSPAPLLAVLTHAHRDHAGGLQRAVEQKIPVVMSDSTFAQLRWRLGDAPKSVRSCRPPASFSLGDGSTVAFDPGAHSPAAMIVTVTDAGRRTQVVFPGDYCLKNHYYQETPMKLLSYFDEFVPTKVLLVDGTFLGHEPKPDGISDLSELRSEIVRAYKENRDVIFLSESPEYLYPLYIWSFQEFYARGRSQGSEHDRRAFFLDRAIIGMLRTTFEPFILRQWDRYDPYLSAVLKDSMSNYLETRRLFPLSPDVRVDYAKGADIFARPSAMEHSGLRVSRDSRVFTVGRGARTLADDLASRLDGVEVTVLDGPDFAFHSSEADTIAIVREALAGGVRPVIFHNFPNRVRKVLRRHKIREESCDVVSRRSLDLSARGTAPE
ncbi:MAG: hypothetical protein ACKVVT_18655 [Dehalococcoidia bacterium]